MSTHDVGQCAGDEHGKLCADCRQKVIDGILTGTRDERTGSRLLQAPDSYAPLHARAAMAEPPTADDDPNYEPHGNPADGYKLGLARQALLRRDRKGAKRLMQELAQPPVAPPKPPSTRLTAAQRAEARSIDGYLTALGFDSWESNHRVTHR